MKKIHLLSLIISLFFISAYSQNDGWNISTTSHENYTGVVVANGRIGILPSYKPFGIEQIILNNVYEKESELGVSRILKGMNFGNLDLEIDGEKISENNISDWKQTLNMKEARLTTSFRFKDKATVTYSVYALRNLPFSGYMDISVEAKKDIKVKATGKITTPEDFKNPNSTFRVLKDLETTMPILQTVAESKFGRQKVATSATFIWHGINSSRENERPQLTNTEVSEYDNELSFSEVIKKGKSLAFAWAAAETSSQDFYDPQNESERFVIYCLLNSKETLLNAHKELWANLWKGDIIIDGDLKSQQDVRLALYHLYSFGRADTNLSISPMGLSSQNYNGHIFWDTELWMFPPLLVLNQDIAKSLVNYRSDRLEMAIKKARNFGYKGAMFPWESDDTGEEATPAWALTGTFEHHITADVAIAFWNFYRVTQNKKWLEERGFPLLKEVANYWASRVTKNEDGSYSINNVVGANEFAQNIDDNAFTNGSAITALNYATEAAKELKLDPDPDWKKVADNIKIHHFDNGTTRENSTYNGEIIKQADANLLAYPLSIVSDTLAIKRDLNYYEPKLSPEGPAMGKSVFAILYARLGNPEEAFRLFKESYQPNKRPPFGALAESATSNNPYFATGAGGMLQTILFGIGGLHITDSGIVQKGAVIPKEWKSLTITGVGSENKTYTVTH